VSGGSCSAAPQTPRQRPAAGGRRRRDDPIGRRWRGAAAAAPGSFRTRRSWAVDHAPVVVAISFIAGQVIPTWSDPPARRGGALIDLVRSPRYPVADPPELPSGAAELPGCRNRRLRTPGRAGRHGTSGLARPPAPAGPAGDLPRVAPDGRGPPPAQSELPGGRERRRRRPRVSPRRGSGRDDECQPAARPAFPALELAGRRRLPDADPALLFPYFRTSANAGAPAPPARRPPRRSAGAGGGEQRGHRRIVVSA